MKKLALVGLLALGAMVSSSLYAQTPSSYARGVNFAQETLSIIDGCVGSASEQIARKVAVAGVAGVLAMSASPLVVDAKCTRLVTLTVDATNGELTVVTTSNSTGSLAIFNGQSWKCAAVFDQGKATLLTTNTYIMTGMTCLYLPPDGGANLKQFKLAGTETNLLSGLTFIGS